MGVINQYLTPTENQTPQAPVTASGGLINQYLAAPSEPAPPIKTGPIAPPISGVSPEESAALNARQGVQGGVNPRDSELIDAVKNLPNALLSSAGKNFKEAGSTLAQGASEVFSNKPASGVGKLGLGLLEGATAVPSAALSELVAKPVANITGSKNIGERAADVAGLALPVVPAAKAIKAVIPKNEAFRKLVEDIGPQNAGKVAAAMEANPRLTPADLSDNVMHGIQKLYANVEGSHVDYLGKVTEARKASAAAHLENEMNRNLGSVVDPVAKLEELQNKIKEVGKKDIQPALQAIKAPIDLTSSVNYIDKKLTPDLHNVLTTKEGPLTDEAKKELQKFRDLFVEEQVAKDGTKIQGIRTISPDSANTLQSVIRSTAERLIERGGQDARIGYALQGLRNHIVDTLDKASGGTYKPALAKYRDEYHVSDAFERGHDSIMANSRKLESRPEFFEKWVKDATPAELEAAREGARIAYDTQMNAFKHAARRGTDIGDVDFNMRRMSALFGDTEAKKMAKIFEDEKRIADRNNKLTQNSQTQMRNAQNSYFEPNKKAGASLTDLVVPAAAMETAGAMMGAPGVGTGLAIALKGANYAGGKVAGKVTKALEENRNMAYAKYALPTTGPDRAQLIADLKAVAAQQSPKPKLSQRAANSIVRLIAP